MKEIIRRIASFLLAIALLFSFSISASAKRVAAPITLNTYTDADEQSRATKFIIYSDELYISGQDALVLSGYDTYEDNYGQPKFRCGYHCVEHKAGCIDFAGTYYYPLKNLMDALSTSYDYDSATETIRFFSCKSYFENLLMDCQSVYAGGYELNFLEGTGWQVAGVYEIISGLRVDVLWGGYERELYEDTLRGIIATEDAEFTATLKQGNSIMKKLSTLLKFTKKDINGLETYAELLGPDLDGVIEAYAILNNLIPGVKVEDMIELIDYFMSAAKLGEIFPNAVRYGLVENPYVKDTQLTMAANRIYALHDKNRVSIDTILTDFMNALIIGGTEKLGEEALKKSFEDFSLLLIDEILGLDYGKFVINASYVKLAKLAFDELGMKDRSTAVMQTVAARNIQFAAQLQYTLSNGQHSYIIYDDLSLKAQENPNPLRTKYSTILYLRACQYAYSLYEFDANLSSLIAYWNEKTTEAIDKLLTYSDEELTRAVCNEKLTFRLSDYIQSEATDDKIDKLPITNIPNEFLYTSGAGAWMTVVKLEKDGLFTGGYHDTNAGETGEEYPNGTTYICNFSGKLDDFEKVDEYTYTTSLLKITTEQNSGEVYYENGVRYITTEPYGFTNADVLYLYLPGTPCAYMPQDCLDWLWYHNLSDTLPSNMYVLYNVNGGEVFFGNIDMPTNVDGRNYKVLESDISGTITDITGKLNIRSGPGTCYEVVGYLLPNDTVEVYETAYNEDITWGHIEQGWISMDYVSNITHRSSANTIYAEDYVDYTTAEILAELGPEYDIPGSYAGSYLLKTINYPSLYFAYNLDNPTNEPYITGFESVVCIYLFGDAAINEYLSANMSKAEIDEAVHNPDVLSASTDTYYMALDNTGNVFQYVIETHKAYVRYEWYLDSGSSTNAPADSVCVSPK